MNLVRISASVRAFLFMQRGPWQVLAVYATVSVFRDESDDGQTVDRPPLRLDAVAEENIHQPQQGCRRRGTVAAGDLDPRAWHAGANCSPAVLPAAVVSGVSRRPDGRGHGELGGDGLGRLYEPLWSGSGRNSRGLSGRVDGSPLHPGHRPAASALGWILPARWAGGRAGRPALRSATYPGGIPLAAQSRSLSSQCWWRQDIRFGLTMALRRARKPRCVSSVTIWQPSGVGRISQA